MPVRDSELAGAFPSIVRDDARLALSGFPGVNLPAAWSFSVRVGSEVVSLPYRVYADPALIHTDQLTDRQRELVDCLLTRHSDGFVREQHLARIIGSNHVWVPPFVIQLVGEYVIEILHLIHQNLQHLDTSVYATFLRENPEFFATTKQRVASYWDCYHRNYKRDEYVGFKLLDFFQSLLRNSDRPLQQH
jgi:hypothetical protein